MKSFEEIYNACNLKSLDESYLEHYGPIGLMMDGADEIGKRIRKAKRRRELKKEGHDDEYIAMYMQCAKSDGYLSAKGSEVFENWLKSGRRTYMPDSDREYVTTIHSGSGMPANSIASNARFRDICIIYEGKPDQIIRWTKVKFPMMNDEKILKAVEMYTGSPDFERRKAKRLAKREK